MTTGDVYWDVTREVKLRFDREGVSIPFPQQDVHINSEAVEVALDHRPGTTSWWCKVMSLKVPRYPVRKVKMATVATKGALVAKAALAEARIASL